MGQKLKVGDGLHLLDEDFEVLYFATPGCSPLRKLVQSACGEQNGILFGDTRWTIDVPVGEGRPARRVELGKNRRGPHGPDLLGFRLDGHECLAYPNMVQALGKVRWGDTARPTLTVTSPPNSTGTFSAGKEGAGFCLSLHLRTRDEDISAGQPGRWSRKPPRRGASPATPGAGSPLAEGAAVLIGTTFPLDPPRTTSTSTSHRSGAGRPADRTQQQGEGGEYVAWLDEVYSIQHKLVLAIWTLADGKPFTYVLRNSLEPVLAALNVHRPRKVCEYARVRDWPTIAHNGLSNLEMALAITDAGVEAVAELVDGDHAVARAKVKALAQAAAAEATPAAGGRRRPRRPPGPRTREVDVEAVLVDVTGADDGVDEAQALAQARVEGDEVSEVAAPSAAAATKRRRNQNPPLLKPSEPGRVGAKRSKAATPPSAVGDPFFASSSAVVRHEDEECAATEIMDDDDVAVGMDGLGSDAEAEAEAEGEGEAEAEGEAEGGAEAPSTATATATATAPPPHEAPRGNEIGALDAIIALEKRAEAVCTQFEFSCDDDAVAEAFGAAVTVFLKRNRGRPPDQSDYDALYEQVRQRLARQQSINGLTFDDAMALLGEIRAAKAVPARLAAMELRIGGCFTAPGGAAAGSAGPSSGSQAS